MALVNDYGPLILPKTMPFNAKDGTLVLSTALAEANTTGELYWGGPWVWDPSIGSTFVAHRIGFMFGSAVTKSNGSTLTLAIQGVSLTTGPVLQPDAVDQATVAIANADASYAASTWYRSAALSADVTLANQGALLAVILRYNSFVAGDTLKLYGWNGYTATSGDQFTNSMQGKELASAFTVELLCVPNVVLEDASGNFATMVGCMPLGSATVQTNAINTGTSTTRAALPFKASTSRALVGFNVWLQLAAGADFACKLRLSSDDSVLATVTIDSNAIVANAANKWTPCLFSSPVSLTGGTAYRGTIEPTTANSVTVQNLLVNTANHLQCYRGGTNSTFELYTTGAWAGPVTTKRFLMEPIYGQYADDTGGGILIHPGMTGGMRG